MVAKLVSELYAKKCVLVPFSLVAAFMLECMHEDVDIVADGYKFENKNIVGQYFMI